MDAKIETITLSFTTPTFPTWEDIHDHVKGCIKTLGCDGGSVDSVVVLPLATGPIAAGYKVNINVSPITRGVTEGGTQT